MTSHAGANTSAIYTYRLFSKSPTQKREQLQLDLTLEQSPWPSRFRVELSLCTVLRPLESKRRMPTLLPVSRRLSSPLLPGSTSDILYPPHPSHDPYLVCPLVRTANATLDVTIFSDTALGHALGSSNRPLVYGGGSKGIMGVVSGAVLEKGGQVLGVVPAAMVKAGGEGEKGEPGSETVHVVLNEKGREKVRSFL